MEEKLKILIAGTMEGTPNYRAAMEQLGADWTVGETVDPTDYDGLILPGGYDIDPALYGCDNCGSEGINRELDLYQLGMLDAFVKAGKPVFGICKGHQLINVYFGGTLIQNVPQWQRHRRIVPGVDQTHMSRAEEGSYLAGLYGTEFPTNSAHHQAADRLGKGLKVIQWSDDGLVEALVHEELPVYCLQWHPERMCFANRREDTVDGSAVLAWFLDRCRERKG